MGKTLIHNAVVYSGTSFGRGWVLVGEPYEPFIEAVGFGDVPQSLIGSVAEAFDAGGAMLLPGMIDTHVHFREPGLTHKATIASESRAAVAGGVTTYFDMPNTVPPTLSHSAIEDKVNIAIVDSMANYAFYLGASADNLEEVGRCNPSVVPGIKLFLGSSTGKMAVADDGAVKAIFNIAGNIPLMVHAEDDAVIAANIRALTAEYGGGDLPPEIHSRIRSAQACLSASTRAVALAERYGTRLHLAHVSTAAEVHALLSEGSTHLKRITAEATPLHLVFSDADYAVEGTRIKVNPSVKTADDRMALREALVSGAIDTIGTDHAPHLLAEKRGGALTAASGAPMVQFALPLLLSFLPVGLVIEKMAHAPAQLFDVDRRGDIAVGNYADMVLVENVPEYEVDDSMVLSPCGWSPLSGSGIKLRHRVARTWVNGRLAYDRGRFADEACGRRVYFNR